MNLSYPDLFNDVFGPIMQPGSSSHLAGPCCAGYLAHSLLGEPIADIVIELDSEGSIVQYKGAWNSEKAMLTGASGHLPDFGRLFEIEDYLREENITYEIRQCVMKESTHVNSMKFKLTGVSGGSVTLVANSVGGGIVETVWVNGYAFSGKGDTYVLFVYDDAKRMDVKSLFAEIGSVQQVLEFGSADGQTAGLAHWMKFSSVPNDAVLGIVSQYDHRVMSPIVPVTATSDKRPQLFDTMTKWVRLAEESGKPLSEIAIDYEIASSGWTRDQIVDYMKNRIAKTMHRRVFAPLTEELPPLTNPFENMTYKVWSGHMKKVKLLNNAISRSILYTSAVIPYYPNVLAVPGPMGSGGGTIYGILHAVMEEMELGYDDLLKGLFVAAGVGAICCSRTATNGTTIGCAGECGCCGAMAAAGVVEMMGGTPKEAETAASFLMQAAIGWPCDKILGGMGRPCTSREVVIATMAIVFAEFSMAGNDALLPFHEVVDVADKVGRNMDPDLRSTKMGGLNAAPAALKRKQQYFEWLEESQQA